MADDTQQLVYKINVITEGVQGKVADVTNELNRVKTTVDAIGKSQLQVNTTKALDEFESLNSMLREVRRGIELLTRNNNAQIIDLNGLPQTMTSLRLLEMQIQDLQKSIKAASLNEIFKSNQKQQINEVTSALQSQRKAIDDITKSMEQQKAMSQSTYYRRRSDFDSANATLGNYNVAPKDNPYGGSWSDYVKQVQAAGTQRERIEKNIAESQSARQARSTAELNNSKQLIQLRNQLQNAENAQNAAIARGNQLEVQRYETLRQQYATAKQALEARGERVSGSEPMSAAQYANPSAFNQQAAISNAMSWDTRGITSYTNEVGKLQRAQESLYAIYKQDPTPTNLANFSATTARLKEVSEQYRVYQRSIQNTGSKMDQFMVKARSHAAWIASGFTIGALFAIPTETIDTMGRIESEMASIKQVMPEIEGDQEKSNAEMQKFIGIASQYGEAIDHVMDAARSIGRMYGQGDNGIANTNLMTQQAAKMATADAFDMTTATKALESAMAQWGLQTQDTNQLMVNSNRILDVWTITAHRGAASAQDIGDAIGAAGAAAAQAGVSFEFFNALVETGVRATGKSGSEIGQAIKSMMVSMQTDKSAKALKEWGIALDEVGTDGVKRMRSMEDVILDVSMAINSTNKDTSKLLMTLSGGKYQYSKISVMLKDYQELLRMMGIINNDKTVGFTTRQVSVQLDTLKRKMQTIKDDLQQGIMGIGANGGLSALKSIANSIDNIVVGLNKMDGTGTKGIAGLVAAAVVAKGIDKLAKSVMTTVQAYKLLSAQSRISQGSTIREGALMQMLNTRYVENTRVAAVARLAKQGYTVAQNAENVGEVQAIFLKAQHTAALARMTTAERLAATTTGVLATATRGLSAAVASFGGPVSLAITLATMLGTALLFDADSQGAAETATRNNTDAIDELIAKSQQQYDLADRQGQTAEKLAKKYNDLSVAINDNSLSEDERAKKTQEMGEIEKTVAAILGEDAVKFDADGKMNIKTIQDKADANRQASIDEINEQEEIAKASVAATKDLLEDTKKRLEAMQKEAEACSDLGGAYNWLMSVIGKSMIARADYAEQNKNNFTGLVPPDDAEFTGLIPDNAHLTDENIAQLRAAGEENLAASGKFGKQALGDKIAELSGEVAALTNELGDEKSRIAQFETSKQEILDRIEENKNKDKRGEVGDDGGSSGGGGKSGGSSSQSNAPQRDLNGDIIKAAQGELDLPYGGSDWRDAYEKVCTTFAQTALAKAGIDESTVDSLTGDARNWASAAGNAFHAYGTGYQTKPGDILLVNTYGDGAHHVAVADENANGYYAAGGSAGVSAHYNTNWETAFSDSGVLGVISVNELAGVPMSSKEGNKINKRSIYDFNADKYEEYQREQELANEKYEQTKKSIEIYEKTNGKDFTSDMLTQQNEEKRLVSDDAAAKMAKVLYAGISKRIADYIAGHPEISDMLNKQGKTWDTLTPKEKETVATLAGNDDMRKAIDEQEQLRKSVASTTQAYEEQRATLAALNVSLINAKYERDAKKITNAQEMKEATSPSYQGYGYSRQKASDDIIFAQQQVDILRRKLDELRSSTEKVPQDAIDEAELSLAKATKNLEKVRSTYDKNLKESEAELVDDIVVKGNSLKDVWNRLWQQLASEAIKAIFQINSAGSGLLSQILGFGKPSVTSSVGQWADLALADGGSTDGGAVRGAGTGRSDSILAYVANKDKFMYLSNGEYVLNSEATKRIGVENLDALNGYADGGALSPTPYVPSINPVTAKKATSISGNGDTVALLKEQNKKMSEQLSLLKGMDKDGGGQMVVLNTQASSADVLKALQENPRAVQALMGQQRRAGFR